MQFKNSSFQKEHYNQVFVIEWHFRPSRDLDYRVGGEYCADSDMACILYYMITENS